MKIKFTKDIFDKTKEFLLQDKNEQICFLFGYKSVNNDGVVVFPDKIIQFEEDPEMFEKSEFRVWVKSDMINAMYHEFIQSDYTVLIHCHSHPFSKNNVQFSGIDDKSHEKEFEYTMTQLPKAKNEINKDNDVYVINMVFGQNDIAARSYDLENKDFKPVDEIQVMDEPVSVIKPTNNKSDKEDYKKDLFDRQVRAFGKAGQKILQNLEVSIVGAGGIGSIIAEGLVKLGVKNIVIIDDDTLEESNLNRWQTGKLSDVGKHKVDVLKENLESMLPGVSVAAVKKRVNTKDGVEVIKNTDCILGCLDNHSTRYFLNSLSTQYLIPYIDGATVIKTSQGNISEIKVRLGSVIPGLTACMDCSVINYYNKKEIQYSFADSISKKGLKKYGYVKDKENIPSPSVYPQNMTIASLMLTEFHNLFTGFKSFSYNIYLDLMDLDNDSVTHLNTDKLLEEPGDGCVFCSAYLGVGDYESLEGFYEDKEIELPELD